MPFERRNIDIMKKAEQFEVWYTALNPKAVVPTLAIDDQIVTDTIRIVYRVERDFDGPSLTPVEPEGAEAMGRMMRDIMRLHYGVLMYSRLLDTSGKSPVVVAPAIFSGNNVSSIPTGLQCLTRGLQATRNCKRFSRTPRKLRECRRSPTTRRPDRRRSFSRAIRERR